MRRLLSLAVITTLTGGFLVVDVVSLPASSPTSPRIQSIALAATLAPVEPSVEPFVASPSAEASTEPSVAGPSAAVPPVAAPSVAAPSAAMPSTEPSIALPEAPTTTGDLLVTETIETQEFSIAGVTWDGDQPEPELIEVRVREADGWSEWTELQATDEGPDAGTEEYEAARAIVGTDPVVADSADAVEVRVRAADDELPTGLEISVIDPGTSPGDETLDESTPLASAAAAVARPSIISRASWGADESMRNCSASYSSGLKAATLHHTAGSNSYSSSDSAGVVRGIYAYHTNTLGWCDVGYNFLIDKYGRIYEGRGGGMDRTVRGAHAGGFNDQTVGVSMMGNYDVTGVPAVMQDAVTRVVAWKLGTAGINPQGSTTLTSAGGGTSKYAAGRAVGLPTVFAHRDVGSTACPGRYGAAILPAVRAGAASITTIEPYVTAVYVDMLKRQPDPTGMTNWSAKIAAAGGNPTSMMNQFTASAEYRNREINDAYRLVLLRDVDDTGLLTWRGKVARGDAKLEDIAVDLLVSEEFYQKKGGTTSGFVRGMYRTVLGRDVDANGLQHWSDVVRRDGRRAATLGIWNSTEATGVRVNAIYLEFLNRSLDATGRATWVKHAQSKGDYYVRDQVVLSTEYRNRAIARF